MEKQAINVHTSPVPNYLYEIYKDAYYVLIKDDIATTIDLTTGKFKKINTNRFLEQIKYLYVYEDENKLRKYLIKKSLGEENV
jgi:hypothetical protein